LNAFADFFHHLDWEGLIWLLTQAAAVLLCLTVHETCHGLAAYALGDPTAKRMHRLSLNPLRHIDPFGALMMLIAGFGWAKPVPVDMRYFRHPKSGMAITALAGPASNFVLAYAALLVYHALPPLAYRSDSGALYWWMNFLVLTALLSIGLGVFNLIPIPPLDGSKILEGILPDRVYYTILRYERYGMLLLMVLLWSGVFDGPLSAVRGWVFEGLYRLSGLPFDLTAGLLGL